MPATVRGVPSPVVPEIVTSAAKGPASGVRRSTIVMPRILASVLALTKNDLLVRGRILEEPAQDRGLQRGDVVAGELAGHLEGHRADAAARELREEAPEGLGQGQVGGDRASRARE